MQTETKARVASALFGASLAFGIVIVGGVGVLIASEGHAVPHPQQQPARYYGPQQQRADEVVSDEVYSLVGVFLNGEPYPTGLKAPLFHLTVTRSADGYKRSGYEDHLVDKPSQRIIEGEVGADERPKYSALRAPDAGRVRFNFQLQTNGDMLADMFFLDHPTNEGERQSVAVRKRVAQ
jgi:hypothetical protein